MASIRKEMVVACAPEKAWDAARDVGAPHARLVRGFVVDCKLEEGARTVTFGSRTCSPTRCARPSTG
jgi:hypothetical protein